MFAAFMGCIDFDVYNVFSVQYADDVTLIESLNVGKPDVISLAYIASQFSNAGLKLNSQKCKQMIFRRSRASTFCYNDFTEVDSIKILGVIFSSSLSWNANFSDLIKRASSRLYILRCVKSLLSPKELIIVYHAIITSLFLYASPVYGCLPVTLLNKIGRVQKRAHRMICGRDCSCDKFPSICDKLNERALKFLRQCEDTPSHPLHHLVPSRLPRTGHFCLPTAATSRRLHSFFPWASYEHNKSLSKR